MPLPLIERSKQEIERAIRNRVESVEGVKGVSNLDVRISGKRLDVNILLLLADNLSWEEAHKIALRVEQQVTKEYPRSRVTVNTEPIGDGSGSYWRQIKEIAENEPGSRGVHNIHIQKINDKMAVDMHLEVSANMTVMQAHHVADGVEKKVKAISPNISDVTVHIESASERVSREQAGFETELESYVSHVAEHFAEIKDVCDIQVRRISDATHLVLRCRFDPNLSIEKAHEISSKFEKEIKSAYPEITRIDVHEEPS